MRKKVIVSVTNDISTDQRVHKVCQSLQAMGFDVLLWGRLLPSSQSLNRPYATKRMRLLFSKGPLFYIEYNIRLFFILLATKSQLLLSNDLDTLLANFLAASLKRLPLIYDSHELFPEAPELLNSPFKKKIWESLEAFLLPRVSCAYTVCDSIAKFYESKYNIDMEVVRNVPYLDESSQQDKSGKTLIYQGGMNPGRGLELLIQSMSFLSDFKLKIIGDGDGLKALKILTKNEGVSNRVSFLGRLPFEALKAHTEQASIGVLFEEAKGLSFEYSLPNKLFDYIHAGTAVLASPLVEVKRIIENNTVGDLLSSREPEMVAKQIVEMHEKINSFEFTKAKKELNWQKEEQVLKGIFMPFLDKA
ncbi:glycosyltransferase [Flavobacteriales bacterium]|jgi:glycosyltransferase involved in cell wall biosynthesis|nr:glycosyltransferase [Flavobacteriales bacterium]